MGTARVFRAVLANRDLRRVELAYVGFNASEYSVWIAMLVYAYSRGGATEASLVAVLQLTPAAIGAPFLALLADRYRPARVLAGGYLAQAAGMALTACAIFADAPVALVYAGAVIASTAVTVTRPAQAVVVPALARSVQELTATNVVSSWVESTGILVASALTGALLAVSGVDLVFGVMAAVGLGSALLVARVDGPEPAVPEGGEGARDEALAGFQALRTHAHLRLLVGLLMGEFLLIGAMDILFVVLALDVLSLDESWVGYLNAAFGAGGVIGGLAAITLVGRRYLAPPIAVGMVAWGAAFVVIAIWPSTLVAVLLLALGGAGRVLLDVGCRTLLQRTTPSEVLGRVFGVLEGLMMAGLAVGSLLIPPLVALGGSKAALIGTGLVLPDLRPAGGPVARAGRPPDEGSRRRDRAAALDAGVLSAARAGHRGRRAGAGADQAARRGGRHQGRRGRRPLLRDRGGRGGGDARRRAGRTPGAQCGIRRDRAARGRAAHRDGDDLQRGAPLRAREGPVRDGRHRACPRDPGSRGTGREAP